MTCSTLLLRTCEPFEEDCFATDEGISIFFSPALNRGDYVEGEKREINSNKGTAQVFVWLGVWLQDIALTCSTAAGGRELVKRNLRYELTRREEAGRRL